MWNGASAADRSCDSRGSLLFRGVGICDGPIVRTGGQQQSNGRKRSCQRIPSGQGGSYQKSRCRALRWFSVQASFNGVFYGRISIWGDSADSNRTARFLQFELLGSGATFERSFSGEQFIGNQGLVGELLGNRDRPFGIFRRERVVALKTICGSDGS